MYSDPMDRSTTHLTNPDPLRLTTRAYNDSIYVKKSDPNPIPSKIKSSTNDNEV